MSEDQARVTAVSTWATAPDCVVICGGKGTRLVRRGEGVAKSMVPLRGRPMIQHIVDAWRPLVGRFIFVVDHLGDQVADHVSTLDIRADIVHEQGNGRGIANALAVAEGSVETRRFVMVLGDCVHRGDFLFPPGMSQGVGVYRTAEDDDIRRSYSVIHDDRMRISQVVEKPKEVPNDLCGTGFYFFELNVFEHIADTPPSALRGQVEITDVLQHMVCAKLPLSAVRLQGQYLNVTYPADVQRAEAMFKEGEQPS